jgi:hypothetical protein
MRWFVYKGRRLLSLNAFDIIAILFSGCGIAIIAILARKGTKLREVATIKMTSKIVSLMLNEEFCFRFKLTDVKGRAAKYRTLSLTPINVDRPDNANTINQVVSGKSDKNGVCEIYISFEMSGEYYIKAHSDESCYTSPKFKVGIGQVDRIIVINESELSKEIKREDALIEFIQLKIFDKNNNPVEFKDIVFNVVNSDQEALLSNREFRSDCDGMVTIKHILIPCSGHCSFYLNADDNEYVLFKFTVIIDKIHEIFIENQPEFPNEIIAPFSVNLIKAQVRNADKFPLTGKNVVFKVVKGDLAAIIENTTCETDEKGCVSFEKIDIKDAGIYEFILECDGFVQKFKTL